MLAVLPDLDSRNTSASSLLKSSTSVHASARLIYATYNSITARQIAASSKRTWRLRSASAGFKPMSDTLTAKSGFPLASATLSDTIQSRVYHLRLNKAGLYLLSMSCLRPVESKSMSAPTDLLSDNIKGTE